MTAKAFLRWLLGLGLIFAGSGHLTFAREEFQAQVPSWLPIYQDLVVIGSGLAELALGLGLLLARKYTRQVGILTAFFFVAIFPGNLEQYFSGTDAFGLNSDQARFWRLWFQPVLVVWALWCTWPKKDSSANQSR